MAGGQGDKSHREACREAGLNTIEEELDEADMVRVFRILNGNNKVDEKNFRTREVAREGAGRRRFKEKEIRRTLVTQRKETREKSFASRVQDPWNFLSDRVKLAKTHKSFRRAYKKESKLVKIAGLV